MENKHLFSIGEISYCVAIPNGSEGEYVENIPEVRALSVYHHGAYEDIPDTRKKLFEYAKKRHFLIRPMQTYLSRRATAAQR